MEGSVAELIFDFEAVPKGRPRAVRTMNSARMVTPADTRVFEDRVKQVAEVYMRGKAMLRGPLHIDMHVCVWPIPKNPPRGKDGTPWPARKPDLDNLEKAVCDALNGIVWSDDAIICSVNKDKHYGESPYFTVKVYEL